jgi:hypothetical protein
MYKNYFYLTLLLLISIISPVSAGNENKYTPEKFLNIARNAHPVKTWAVLIGTVSNRRRGTSSTYKAVIKVGMRFTNTRILAKITIREMNEDLTESYTVGQPYNGQPTSVLTSESNENDIALLGEFGLRPEDLTMTFLYWDLEKEFKNEPVKGFNCRVLGLVNPETKEFVKVFISSKYYYPIKVKWFKPNQKKAYRNVVISSFETDGSLGAPSELNLYGPGWRTKVDFDKIRLGYAKDGIPKDIFTEDSSSE